MKSNKLEQNTSNKKYFVEKYFLNSENDQKQSHSEKQVKTPKTGPKNRQRHVEIAGSRNSGVIVLPKIGEK